MRMMSTLLLSGLLVSGCAWSGQAGSDQRSMKAIEDVEPAVTAEVAAALSRIAGDPQAETAPLLRACPSAVPLELLRRTVNGEERTYLYRALCPTAMLVTVTYGKSATIKQLTVNKE
ncbi:hypothetical protein GCM10027277_04560 [Pseudoduganella ginsengisoli]|uniref:Lipoprotein n=1 Tax=Pseudoduganella ginsengisoli TaxID=1462440 RepID=A0A6L6Q6J4_9BURK|nr:hypothetical protein [Pseudoduganella ginsengisoli]MTW04891.1 hypothetical protein [Pseudoduganella ginsengisoli]